MSQRSRTTLLLTLRIPVPPNRTQKLVLVDVAEALRKALPSNYATQEIIIKLTGRETVYY